jgi:hypothetical protein
MKKGLLGILAVGMMSTAANAGILSLRFAGGATEVTLAPSESVTVEVIFRMNATDKKTNKVTGFDARFDVGGLTASPTGEYVQDGSLKDTVTAASPGAFANWNTAATSGVGGPFNGDFFMSAGDPAGVSGPVGNGTEQGFVVLGSFVIHKDTSTPGTDTLIVYRQGAALPAVYNGAATWANRFGSPTINGAQQFETEGGNSGDNRPQDALHGYETLNPLVVHHIPEPSVMALLALGGLAALRRRS